MGNSIIGPPVGIPVWSPGTMPWHSAVFAGKANKGDSSSWYSASPAAGIPSTKVITFAGWIYTQSTTPAAKQAFGTENSHILFGLSSAADGKVFEFIALDSAGSAVVKVSGTTAMSVNTWYHFAVAVDVNVASQRAMLYLNGVSDLASVVHSADALMDFGDVAQYLPLNPTIIFAQLWADNSYVDISAAGQIDKWILQGKPVFMGDNGELVTGSQPFLCMQDVAPIGQTNSGSGADWIESGTIVPFSPGPGV